MKLKQFASLEHSATTFSDNEEIHFSFECDSENKNDSTSAFDQIQNTDMMKTARNQAKSSEDTSSSSEDHFDSKNQFIKKACCKTEIIENKNHILQEKEQSNIHRFGQSISKTSGTNQSNKLMYIRLYITLHNGNISKTFSRVD